MPQTKHTEVHSSGLGSGGAEGLESEVKQHREIKGSMRRMSGHEGTDEAWGELGTLLALGPEGPLRFLIS